MRLERTPIVDEERFDMDGMCHFFIRQFTAYPDRQTIIDDRISEGDKVVMRMTIQGTSPGAFMGMPPTGKSVTWSFIDIFRIVDGKFVEHWVEMDTIARLRQWEIIPPLA